MNCSLMQKILDWKWLNLKKKTKFYLKIVDSSDLGSISNKNRNKRRRLWARCMKNGQLFHEIIRGVDEDID